MTLMARAAVIVWLGLFAPCGSAEVAYASKPQTVRYWYGYHSAVGCRECIV
jgi:hypothetical protein